MTVFLGLLAPARLHSNPISFLLLTRNQPVEFVVIRLESGIILA